MADWEWFFASEYGRDKMLRSEIESLSYASASANASNARLTSQLARLQGSLESRLTALSAAFDAYVELGDVREQLAAYGDTAAVRRDVAEAIEALAAGRTADPVDVGDTTYWLPYAANAVIALAAGTADSAAEERARALSRDADLFVVITLGALGHGAAVADRVPDLLVTDGSLRPAQVVLWTAVLDGVYPSSTDLLGAIGERWRPALDTGTGPEWREWVSARSGAADAVAVLQWIREFVAGRLPASPTPPAAAPVRFTSVGNSAVGGSAAGGSDAAAVPESTPTPPDPGQALRSIATSMVAEGSDDERVLLYRARELRRRIEDPAGVPAPTGPTEEARQLVRELVWETLDRDDPDLRSRLTSWLRPGLLRAVDELALTPRTPPAATEARTPGGTVSVEPTGPDRRRLEQAQANILAAHPWSNRTVVGAGATAGGLTVVALVVALAGGPVALVVLALIAAIVLGVVALRAVRQRVVARQEIAADSAQLQRSVDQAVERAQNAKLAYDESTSALSQLVRELRSALTPAAG